MGAKNYGKFRNLQQVKKKKKKKIKKEKRQKEKINKTKSLQAKLSTSVQRYKSKLFFFLRADGLNIGLVKITTKVVNTRDGTNMKVPYRTNFKGNVKMNNAFKNVIYERYFFKLTC